MAGGGERGVAAGRRARGWVMEAGAGWLVAGAGSLGGDGRTGGLDEGGRTGGLDEGGRGWPVSAGYVPWPCAIVGRDGCHPDRGRRQRDGLAGRRVVARPRRGHGTTAR